MAAPYYRVNQYYLDSTTNALWICTGAGDKTTSTWAQIFAAANPIVEIYNNAHAYPVGSTVFVDTTTTIGGITIYPGCYMSITAVPVNGTGNQIPQSPLPAGTVYWRLLAYGSNTVNTCASGGGATVLINSTGTF